MATPRGRSTAVSDHTLSEGLSARGGPWADWSLRRRGALGALGLTALGWLDKIGPARWQISDEGEAVLAKVKP